MLESTVSNFADHAKLRGTQTHLGFGRIQNDTVWNPACSWAGGALPVSVGSRGGCDRRSSGWRRSGRTVTTTRDVRKICKKASSAQGPASLRRLWLFPRRRSGAVVSSGDSSAQDEPNLFIYLNILLASSREAEIYSCPSSSSGK